MGHLDLSSILNLVSTVAVVGALIFTALQVRAANISRRDQAAITLIQTTQNSSWTEGLKVLFTLPENATVEHPRATAGDGARALRAQHSAGADRLHGLWRQRDLAGVDELMGGVVLGIWSRSRAWTEEYRRTTNNEKFNEWVEWLADRIAERHARVHPQPAHRQYRHWRERSF